MASPSYSWFIVLTAHNAPVVAQPIAVDGGALPRDGLMMLLSNPG
jgi:hypothetical protein